MVFIPLSDDNPLRAIRFQWVTVGLIVANVAVFIWQSGSLGESAAASFALIPNELFQVKIFGGSAAAAALHVARTVSRRAERCIVELAGLPDEPVEAAALKYVNRLSDHLFVASRYVNARGEGDVLWVPGQNR